jgi:hypothetical protein
MADDSFLQAGLRLTRSLDLVTAANISTRNSVIVSVVVQGTWNWKWYGKAIAEVERGRKSWISGEFGVMAQVKSGRTPQYWPWRYSNPLNKISDKSYTEQSRPH